MTVSPTEREPAFRSPDTRNAFVIIAMAWVIFFLRYAMDCPIPIVMALVFAAVLEPITHRRRAIGGSIYLVSDDFTAAIETRPALSPGLKDRPGTEQTAAPYTVKKSPRPPAASKTLPAP